MFSTRNLRFRISVAFFAMCAVLSGLFAVATFISFEVIRPLYSEYRFAADLDEFFDQHNPQDGPGQWTTPSYRAYVAERDDLSTLPPRLRGLEPGRHQIEHRGEPSEVQVEERAGLLYLLEYDIEEIEAIEGEITRLLIALLSAGALISSLLALAFGYWISSRIIKPVTSLARRVESLDATEAPDLTPAAYGTDEVADLGRAFERYFRRQQRFVEREKDFAAAASHELRTSVASIASSVELLMTEDHQEPTRSRLERLRRASDHMGRLIEALLILAREGTVAANDPAKTAIGPLLREIVDSRERAAAARRVRLTLDLGPSPDLGSDFDHEPKPDHNPPPEATAAISPEGLSIVVGNLIDNAIAYAPEGEVHVRLSGHLVEIADKGPGIPEHELPYVFQRAFRGKNSAGSGAGLGLSIVRRLCDHYGWRVAIESQAGQGTRVHLDLAPVNEN